MTESGIDGVALKSKFAAAVKNVSQNIELINQLNVFPVPDGDTGINLRHTLQRAWQEIADLDDADVHAVAERFAYGALMGARGNSGTILSQLLTGFAEGLAEERLLTVSLLRDACDSAVKRAYAAVSQPVEGTILTVARETSASLENVDTLELAQATLIASARQSLKSTPDKLPLLREAGVVDAGGMGLLCFLEGLQGHSCAAETGVQSAFLDAPMRASQASTQADAFGYDVQFVMLGADLDVTAARRELESIGWSVIAAGDQSAIKVHVHVDNPALPLDYAIRSGAALTDVVIENMNLQAREFTRRQPLSDEGSLRQQMAVIAVAEGEGMKAIFRDLGCAIVIDGGAGKNPATEDFVKAIDRVQVGEIVLLPNSRNVFLAAQQAAELRPGKQVRIVEARNMAEGISAMIAAGDAGDSGIDLNPMTDAMEEAIRAVKSIEITRATRSTKICGLQIEKHDYIAIIAGEIRVATDAVAQTLLAALELTVSQNSELVTLYYGAELDEGGASDLIEHLLRTIKGIEYEAIYGGQPLYPLLVSIE